MCSEKLNKVADSKLAWRNGKLEEKRQKQPPRVFYKNFFENS